MKINPFSPKVLEIALQYDKIVFFEEGSIHGGAAEGFLAQLVWCGFRGKVECVGVSDGFVPAATIDEQLAMYGLEKECMTELLKL